MKNLSILLIILLLLSCGSSKEKPPVNSDIIPELIAEKDGCRLYRVRYSLAESPVYWSICNHAIGSHSSLAQH